MSEKIKHMAILKNDCSLWTPDQALEDFKTKGITMKKMVMIYEYEIDGTTKLGYCAAGLSSRFEQIGLVSTHLHAQIADTFEDSN